MAVNPVLKEAQQKGMISSSVNSNGEVGRNDAPTYTYANPVMREFFGETASVRAERQQQIAEVTRQKREEEKAAAEAAAKQIEKDRVKNTISGGLKNTFSNIAEAFTTKYEKGQGGRTARNQESLSEYEYGLARAQKIMDDMLAANAEMPGSVSENEIRSQQNIIDDWQRKVDSMKTVLTDNVQQKATQASYETADLLQQSAQADIEKAKQGASKAGQFAVDVGAAATQMVGDVALGKMLGFNTGSPAMALRSFGGGAQKARHDGANLNQRIAYGAGGAALGVLTEKLGNIGLFKNIYGAGVFDKAISKLAAKPAGVLAMSMISEGGEEFLEAALEPVLQRITYNPSAAYDSEFWADTLYSVAIGAALGGIGGVTAARHASKNKQSGTTANTAAETAPEATIAPEQSVDTAEAKAPTESVSEPIVEAAKRDSLLDAIIKTFEPVSNKQAEALLADADAVAEMGIDTNGMTKSQQRAAVKEKVAEMQREVPAVEAYKAETANPAIGAADAGFDPVQQLVDKYGAMPEGEGPITQERVVQVPNKTADDQYVSQSVRNAMEAQAIPNETAELIEPALVAGAFSDVRKTNAESVAVAEKTIRDQGWDAALDSYMADVAQGKASAEQTALGWTLMNNAANAGDGKTAIKILVSIAQNSRNTAQALQANRVLKQMSPAGQLYGIQQSINGLQSELNKTHGNNAPTLSISEELADRFLATETQSERDAVMGEIMQNVADQVPSTWKDKWKAWRYMAMLANPRTHVRNILGNVGFQPVRVVKNEIAAALEAALSAAGVDVARTKSFAASPALYKAAWNDFDNVGNLLGGNRYESETSQIKSMRTIFDNKALEGVRTKNSELLEAEDAVFKHVTYADALAGYLKANGVTAEQWAEMVKGSGKATTAATQEIMPAGTEVKAADRQNFGKIQKYNPETGKYSVYFENKNGGRATVELDASLLTPTKPISNKAAKPSDGMAFVDQARAYAAKEAMKATYQDDSAFARRVEKVAESLGPVGEAVMPFKRTPANILSRAMEYSPAGLAKSLTADLIKVQQGKMTATDAIDNIAAGLTGSGLFALGAYLFAEGLITGAQGDDEDDKWNDLLGHQGYALELPNGKSITLDWLAPEAIPFFMGVETVSAMGEGGFTAEAMWDALKAAADPMLEQSMLQGVNDLIESVQYAEDAPLKAIIPSIITSYFSQAIPTVLGQIERSGEEERMTTYTEKDSPISTDLQYALGRASARLPGPEYNQIPYIDAWGRTEETGDTLTRIFNNTLNPAYVSQVEVDKVESELQRVRDATGETSVFPDRAKKYFAVDGETKNLTKDEYVKYATKLGQTSYKTVSALVNNAGYKKLSDEEKAEAISYAYQYANAVAKSSVSNYKADSGWVKGAMNSVLPTDAYILYSINKDRNGNGSVDGTETALTLKEISGLTDKQRGQQWAIAHSTTNPDKNPFTGALPKSGMSVDTAIKIYDKYRVLSNDDNLKSKEQAQMFGQYIYSLGLPKNQLDAVKNVYKVWGNYPIEW